MTPEIPDCQKPAVRVKCPDELLKLPELLLVDVGDRDLFNSLTPQEQLARLWRMDIHHRTLAANLHDQLEQAVGCIRKLEDAPSR